MYVFADDEELDVFGAGILFGSHHQLVNGVAVLAVGVVVQHEVALGPQRVQLRVLVVHPIPVLKVLSKGKRTWYPS